MSRLDELIAELCPNGVEYKTLAELAQISAGGDLPNNYVKGQISPTEQYPYPIYSNGTADGALYGYSDSFKIEQEAITVSARGTIGYHEIRKGKFTPIVRLITLIVNESIVTTKFLNYALYVAGIEGVTTGIPSLTVPMLKKSVVPVPPLPVQSEIVRILDNFTELTADLTAELTARQKQYAYYRNQLMSFDENSRVKWLDFDECCIMSRGDYITKKDTRAGNIPVILGGQEPAYYIDKANHLGQAVVISRSGASAGFVSYWDEPIFVTDGFIIEARQNMNIRFIYLFFKNMQSVLNASRRGAGVPHITGKTISSIKVPAPANAEQERIIAILDRFDTLCNDICNGLPAEIAARQKQYEYYRDKLLTFQELT